jgi:hypothetical protein
MCTVSVLCPMRITFRNQLSVLKECSSHFYPASNETRIICMHNLPAMPLDASKELLPYFETLLFKDP